MGKIYQFTVPDIMCVASCITSIEDALKNVDALLRHNSQTKISVRVVGTRLYVDVQGCDKMPEQEVRRILKNTIEEESGLKCDTEIKSYHLIKGIIGLIAGAGMLTLCVLSGLGILAFPFAVLCLLAGSSALLTIFLGIETYVSAIKNLFINGTFATMDMLYLISTVAALGVSIASLWLPF